MICSKASFPAKYILISSFQPFSFLANEFRLHVEFLLQQETSCGHLQQEISQNFQSEKDCSKKKVIFPLGVELPVHRLHS